MKVHTLACTLLGKTWKGRPLDAERRRPRGRWAANLSPVICQTLNQDES